MQKIIMLLTVLVTSAYAQDTSYKPKYSTILDSSKGKLLLKQCSRWTPKKISGFWTPTQHDIEKLEKEFVKVKDLEATVCCIINGSIRSLDNFAFQYIKKKKYLYVNAFHAANDAVFHSFYKDWKTDPIVMCDGGDYYGVFYSTWIN